MAQAGVLAGATVLNDLHLANRLRAAGAEWVVVREYDIESMPDLHGNADDIGTGRDKWSSIRGRYIDNGLDKRVYIQPHNELNHPADGFYYRGLLEAAHADGFKLAIFADSHGNPAGDTFEPTWRLRVSSGCMLEAARGGSAYCYHSYGPLDPVTQKATDQPGSGIYYDSNNNIVRWDNDSWRYYGGRYVMAYEQFVPPDQRIPVVLGEAGASDATFYSATQVIRDLMGYRERSKADPYLKCVMYWSVGSQPPWGFSNFGPALPAILDWLKSL